MLLSRFLLFLCPLICTASIGDSKYDPDEANWRKEHQNKARTTTASPKEELKPLETILSEELRNKINNLPGTSLIPGYSGMIYYSLNRLYIGVSTVLIDQMFSILPSLEEKQTILKDLEENPLRPIGGLQFFVDLIRIENVEEKLRILRFRSTIEDQKEYLNSVVERLNNLIIADNSIKDSQYLPKLLQLITAVRNEHEKEPKNTTWFEVVTTPTLSKHQLKLLTRIIRHEFPAIGNVFEILPNVTIAGNVDMPFESVTSNLTTLIYACSNISADLSAITNPPYLSMHPMLTTFTEQLKNTMEYVRKNVGMVEELISNTARTLGAPDNSSLSNQIPIDFFKKLADFLEKLKTLMHIK